MIGNDIIDLDLAKVESNWKRKGYIEKIFTASEQLLIGEAENPDIMVWALWSRKESAYKIYNRQTGVRKYNPMQFECSAMEYLQGYYAGTIKAYENVYYSKTEITTDRIYTVAVSDIKYFESIYSLGESAMILKSNGIPAIFDNDMQLRPVSVSHHGRFRKAISI